MANKFRVNTIFLSGKEISVDNNDPNSYLSHDGTFKNPIIGLSTSGNVEQTGISLKNSINLVSGNLIQTGINILEILNNYTGYNNTNPSGYLTFVTGSFYPYNNPSNFTTSGNLQSTGQALYGYIVGLSGVINGNIVNLYTTGSNLYNLINNFSGVFNTSGAQYQNQINTLTSNLTTTGQTLNTIINILSGNSDNIYVNRLTNQNITGYKSFVNTGLTIGTGIIDNKSILSVYGHTQQNSWCNVASFYAGALSPIAGSTSGGAILILGDNPLSFPYVNAKTEIHAGKWDNSNYGTKIYSSIQDSTGLMIYLRPSFSTIIKGAIITSGVNIGINNLNPIYTLEVSGSGNFTSGLFVSGMSVSTGDLVSSGSILYNLINNFSGVFNNSGIQYQNQLDTLTVNLQSTGISLKSSLDLVSGNLITTGQTIDNKINSISGWVNNTSRVSSISITGFSEQTGAIKISGLGNVTTFTGDNNFIYISGTAGTSSDTASNLGVGLGIFAQKAANDFQFYSITGATGSIVSRSGNTLLISSTSVGGGGFNPSGSGSYIFRSGIQVGIDKQFIWFPSLLNQSPRVVASVHNNYDDTVMPVQISGAVSSGFWAVFPNNIPNTGYFIDVFGATSDTGLASTIIVNSTTNNNTITGTQLSITGSSIFTGLQFTGIGSTFLSTNNHIVYISGSGEDNTASNLSASGLGLFSQKVGTDLQFSTLFGGTGATISRSGNAVLVNNTTPACVTFSSSAITLTNMALALNFYNGAVANSITFADLSPYSQVNTSMHLVTAGTVTGFIALRYRGNYSTTVTDYLVLDVDDTKLRMNTAGVISSGWHNLVPGAKSGVYLSLIQSGGNAVADPAFGIINAFFR